ncbi:MICOS complex subunit Mic60-like [Homalodisca vitripennis]|uniref:MICOS complex subunit Mic60-like n=1 Tax=Homalodisca vitripennis TaxID=197043 RepID=UPI001EEC14A9|nr:MICOS complex subunit Mic60-like [Homalodisca vitripennis]
MMISQVTKILSRTVQTVGRFSSNPQSRSLLLIQMRCKQTSTEKRCEEKPKKSRKLVTAATIAVVGTTVAVIAAKNDEEFREWSKEHLPALDSLVRVVYEEEETYWEFLTRTHEELTQWVRKMLYDALKSMKGGGEKKGGAAISEVCVESKKPYKPPESAFLVKKDEEKKDEKETSEKSGALPKHMKELTDMEERLGKSAQETIQSYHAVVCALKEQANLVDSLDQLISKHECKLWEKLGKKMSDEKNFSEKAEAALSKVQSVADRLKTRLEEDSQLTEDVKTKARNNLTIVMGDVQRAKEHLEKEKGKLVLAKRSWEKIRQARMHFTEELETLFPNVWLNDEKLNLPLDSLDPFIQNVLDNIVFLDKELSKLQTVRDAEVSSAVERFRSTGDPESLIFAMVNLEGGKEKRFRQEEMQRSLLTHQAKCDKNARAQMKQQAEVYHDLKAEAISMKEREVERKMQQQLEERLAQVRAQHKMEIAKMVGRIQGANEAIAQRGDKDKDQQEKQQFWSSAQSLLSAIKPIGASKQKDPKPLKNEITNLTKAAPEGDELVESVVGSIPHQASERGVESESRLKERFLKLETEARKVAGVPEGEVSLLQIMVARLQSILYVDEDIPQLELDNEPIDVDQLNNYEVLHRARYISC